MAYELGTTYQLFSHCGTGLCLGVSGGTVANNKNVCIQTKNSNNQQKWIVKAFGSNLKIVSCLNQNYALNYYWSAGQGNAGNCDIYPQSGNDADSSVVLEPVATDVYRIKLKNYNLYLTAKGTGANADVRWEAPVSLGSDYSKLAPQEWRIVDPLAKGIRAPLIYAGFFSGGKAYLYDDNQLKGLDNATEFVICSGVFDEYFDSNGTPNSNGKIQQYVVAAAEMTRRLRLIYPSKQVWIGTPIVGSNVSYNNQAAYAQVGLRMTYFIQNIMAEFNRVGLNFSNCVKGIYMSDETIYGDFDLNKKITDKYQVQMFQTVANYVASIGKKMLWIPHGGTGNMELAARVIHETNIFDYALLQPSYYFGKTSVGSCYAVRQSIAMQRVCYDNIANYPPILHESSISCTKTIIGCDMEIDHNYVKSTDPYRSTEEYIQAYDESERIFNQSSGAYSKYNANFAFYFGCPKIDGMTAFQGYDTVKNKVNTFFK